ncbi:MAG: prolipoprotein diacylglyceryl transferase [Clostridia bacterium]|nr:prolipoprotein diacylglyceryl transferase [Clostridia bacterium]
MPTEIYNVTIFDINLTINPIAFTIPFINWSIHWYGIILATGFFLAIVYGMKNAKRFGVDPDKMIDVILVTAPISILCARTYYVIFDDQGSINSIAEFFGFGTGFSGIAIYGAVIGAFACGAIMCKIKKIKILDLADLAALGFLIGQGIGRWGNFMNQEAFGSPTGSSWWGMTSENVVALFNKLGYDTEALAHPCFLYESIWCILGFFILHKLSKKRHFSGEIVLMYCVWYGFERAIVENLRTDSLGPGDLRISVVVSIILFVGAAITLIVIRKKQKTAIIGENYAAVFEDEYDALETNEDNVEDTVLEENTNE